MKKAYFRGKGRGGERERESEDGLITNTKFELHPNKGREGHLRDEIGALKAELHSASETISNLTTRLEQTRRDMATAAGKHTESIWRAVAGREDAVAKVKILHARIPKWCASRSSIEFALPPPHLNVPLRVQACP